MSKRYTSEQIRGINLKRKFGTTIAEYDQMLRNQGGVCALCKCPEYVIDVRFTNKPKRLTVDHCHKTGRIRGLLCSSCNRAIGLFKEDIALIKKAVNYLSK